jgi:hypothetical protein
LTLVGLADSFLRSLELSGEALVLVEIGGGLSRHVAVPLIELEDDASKVVSIEGRPGSAVGPPKMPPSLPSVAVLFEHADAARNRPGPSLRGRPPKQSPLNWPLVQNDHDGTMVSSVKRLAHLLALAHARGSRERRRRA